MKKINFVLCIHSHQPVGNFDHILEDAFEKSYRPFLDVLYRYQSIKVVIHISGNLLLWLAEKKLDYIAKIRDLVKDGRAEIISSGLYEPALAVLPEVDRIGQVIEFNRVIEEITGYKPKGAWLTERIYEPHLPKSLSQSSIEYIVVDDYHFIKAGLKEEDLFGYYVTEEEGHILKVFPGSEKLRYLIPFKDPAETLGYFQMIAETGKGNLAVFADDGEKFGSWPNTFKWVYEQRWLENFFKMLEANRDIVETVTFSEYIAKNPATGRVYLPTCSYMEMGKWTLPADAAGDFDRANRIIAHSEDPSLKRFITGGMWRNYFAKYPESNNMHKKMLYISKKIHSYYEFDANEPPPDYLLELYKAQCNDAYWHGVFGGLYLPHLRDALYRHMISAEKMLDRDTGNVSFLEVKEYDINRDCDEEILVESDKYNMYIQPNYGGTIFEFDYKPALFNIMNSLTRRAEEYHNKILEAKSAVTQPDPKTIHDMLLTKEEGLDKYLIFDNYNKVSLIDHFLDNISLEDFRSCKYKERGDFIGKNYDYEIVPDENNPKIVLKRRSFVLQGEKKLDVEVKKIITLDKNSTDIAIDYHVKNLSSEELTSLFGVEFNISLLSPNDDNRYFEVPGHELARKNLASEGELFDIKKIRMVDRYFNFDVCFDFPQGCNFYRFPVETVSISEEGFERIFQASTLLFFKMLSLAKDDELVFPIRYSVKNK